MSHSPRIVTVDAVKAGLQNELLVAEHVVHMCEDFTEGETGLMFIELAMEDVRHDFGH